MLEERETAGTREEGADGARTGKAGVADARARHAWRMPLSFLIARYFFYVARRPRGSMARCVHGVQH